MFLSLSHGCFIFNLTLFMLCTHVRVMCVCVYVKVFNAFSWIMMIRDREDDDIAIRTQASGKSVHFSYFKWENVWKIFLSYVYLTIHATFMYGELYSVCVHIRKLTRVRINIPSCVVNFAFIVIRCIYCYIFWRKEWMNRQIRVVRSILSQVLFECLSIRFDK